MGANPGARAILFSPQSRREDIPVAQATPPLPNSCVEPHPPLRFRQNLILNPEAERIVQAVFRSARETIKKQFLTLQCLQVILPLFVRVFEKRIDVPKNPKSPSSLTAQTCNAATRIQYQKYSRSKFNLPFQKITQFSAAREPSPLQKNVGLIRNSLIFRSK